MPGGLIPRDPKAETRTRRALGGLSGVINSLIENGTLQLVGPGQYVINPRLLSQGAAPVLFEDTIADDGMVVPGPAGPAGASGGGTGAAGPPGPALFLLEAGPQGDDGVPVPGVPGPAGAPGAGLPGAMGPVGIPLEDGPQGDDGVPVPGPQGLQGAQGVQGSVGAALSLLEAGPPGDDAIPIPGPQGLQGLAGVQGVQGQVGVPYEDGPQGDDGVPIPGPQGLQGASGAQGPAGPALFLLESGPQGDDGVPIPSPSGGSGSVTSITAGTGLTGGTITSTGTIAVATTIPQAETIQVTDSATLLLSTVLSLDHESSGTTLAGFGASLDFLLQDTTTASNLAGRVAVQWFNATHASRSGMLLLGATGTAGTAYGLSVGLTGGSPSIGFLNNTSLPVVAQTGDAGTALATFGLMTGTPKFASANLTGTTTNQYILLQDQKTSGTAGGTSTTNTWVTRTLNTNVTDTGSNCSLASNLFTLTAGTYRIRASAPCFNCLRHQIRLQNTTSATTILVGTSEYCGSVTGTNGTSRTLIEGRFTVVASQALAIQHIVQASALSTNDFGVPGSFGTEVYTVVELEKEAT